MLGNKGRPNQEVYIDGNMYIAKKPLMLSGSVAVVVPKDWLEAAAMGREIRYILINTDSLAELKLKLYYDKLPAGQERE